MNNSVQPFHSVSAPDSDTHTPEMPTGATTSSAADTPAGTAACWVVQGHTVDEPAEVDNVHKTAVAFVRAAVADSTPVDIPIAAAG